MWKSSTVTGRTVAVLSVVTAFALASCSTDTGVRRIAGIVKSSESGDSVRIEVGDVEKTVRLAFLEAPTTPSSGETGCLAEESTVHLRSLVPAGAAVEFEDVTADDGSPAIFLFDAQGRSVNASMLESGLTIPTDDDGSGHDELADAAARARTDRAGLYSDDTSCTAPAVFASADVDLECLTASSSNVGGVSASASPTSSATSSGSTSASNTDGSTPPGSATAADLRLGLPDVAARAAELSTVAKWISNNESSIAWRALTSGQQSACRTTVVNALALAEREHERLLSEIDAAEVREAEAARVAEEQRRAAEAEAARVAEEQRLAAEAEAARVAEEQRRAAEAEAERAAEAAAAAEASRQAELDRQRNQSDSSSGSGNQSSSNSGGGSSGSYPGYTGPRCYAPGGKTWKPC